MISKRLMGVMKRETKHRKDIVSSLVLLAVGVYLFAKEYSYISYEISYFSLIVLAVGILLFIRSLSN